MRAARTLIVALALVLTLPAAALAASYGPSPKVRAQTPKPKGKGKAYTVCKKGCFATKIQKAVDAAKPGDRIVVKHGTYKEGVKVKGAKKAWITIVGDPRNPDKVVLDGKGLKGIPAQNAIVVDGADGVRIEGFHAKNYLANGFFVRNVTGYVMTDLVAEHVGAYGIFAFNSRGGEMSDSKAFYNNDSGFYIGQTPRQKKPIRSIVRNVESYGNVLGFSGTNMRYVTITKSRFYNNGDGIVPNALDSEKFPPPEDNVISDNEVFWNNFNYYLGAPFTVAPTKVGGIPYPVGIGILLYGSRGTVVEKNKIYGNYLTGFGMIQAITLKNAADQPLLDNTIRNNAFGLGGTDKNGRDLAYDGDGENNCFAGNTGVETSFPTTAGVFATCPFKGKNTFDSAPPRARRSTGRSTRRTRSSGSRTRTRPSRA